HRAAVAPAAQVRQGAFAQIVLPADPEHDLERPVLGQGGGGRGEEREEVVRLIGTGGDPQRFHGQRRIPYPGVAVVPVPFPSGAFGQRGGGGRDDRPARLEGQRLQHAPAVVHQLPPGAVVRLVK